MSETDTTETTDRKPCEDCQEAIRQAMAAQGPPWGPIVDGVAAANAQVIALRREVQTMRDVLTFSLIMLGVLFILERNR